MAKKTRVITICDRHDGEIEAAGSVAIDLQGDRRQLDLCAEHLREFERAVKPWLGTSRRRAAAKPASRNGSRPTSRRAATADRAEIREWARTNGFVVSDRGRLPSAAVQAYAAAH